MKLKDLINAAKEKTSGLGSDKLTELTDSINSVMPIIADAGYVVEQIETTLGIPPKVLVRARVVREIPDEEYDALVERVGDEVASSVVAGTFLKAAALQRTFRIGGLRSSELDLELSPLPAVRLLFEPGSAPPAAAGAAPELIAGQATAPTA